MRRVAMVFSIHLLFVGGSLAGGEDVSHKGEVKMKVKVVESETAPMSARHQLLQELNRRSSMSGMTRSLASDPIGVSGESIFEMLSRRYQEKEKTGGFLP